MAGASRFGSEYYRSVTGAFVLFAVASRVGAVAFEVGTVAFELGTVACFARDAPAASDRVALVTLCSQIVSE